MRRIESSRTQHPCYLRCRGVPRACIHVILMRKASGFHRSRTPPVGPRTVSRHVKQREWLRAVVEHLCWSLCCPDRLAQSQCSWRPKGIEFVYRGLSGAAQVVRTTMPSGGQRQLCTLTVPTGRRLCASRSSPQKTSLRTGPRTPNSKLASPQSATLTIDRPTSASQCVRRHQCALLRLTTIARRLSPSSHPLLSAKVLYVTISRGVAWERISLRATKVAEALTSLLIRGQGVMFPCEWTKEMGTGPRECISSGRIAAVIPYQLQDRTRRHVLQLQRRRGRRVLFHR